jgi:uncharacterized protein YcaQ
MNEIVSRIQSEGPLRLKDFDNGKQSDAKFWKVGPTRRAFERLFMQGDLMVSERYGMQKQFDLRENCLPSNTNLSMPSIEEYADYLFDSTLRAHTVFTFKQLTHLKTGKVIRDAMRDILNQKLASGSIAKVEGMSDTFTCSSVFENCAKSRAQSRQIRILSPFDNLLIHRERLSKLFNYEYRLECYVPVAKRKFGYFCLPILFNNEFVARMDCKAHRKEKRFEIIQFHLETEQINKTQFKEALAEELERFIAFHHCDNSIDLNTYIN